MVRSDAMQRSDFFFHLPPELIAQHPLPNRSDSRLLVVGEKAKWRDLQFSDLSDLLSPGDRLVFNNTKVIPARLFGHKSSGGKVEILIERITTSQQALAHIRASKAPKAGSTIILQDGTEIVVVGRIDALFQLQTDEPIMPLLQRLGSLPLPPYITHAPDDVDLQRYQTVYAQQEGAVAAPTAGLHFDAPLLDKLRQKGITSSEITLHVGAGTFQPVRCDNLSDHVMHSEWLEVTQQVCDEIYQTREEGGRIIAVGTTVVRSLESAAVSGTLQPFRGETNIFITPGYHFQVVDQLITNFHLPESTLLMLVSAFAGYQTIMDAYAHAIAERYRFFSYGDAMLLTLTGEAS